MADDKNGPEDVDTDDETKDEVSENELEDVAGGIIVGAMDFMSENDVTAPEITNPAIRKDTGK